MVSSRSSSISALSASLFLSIGSNLDRITVRKSSNLAAIGEAFCNVEGTKLARLCDRALRAPTSQIIQHGF